MKLTDFGDPHNEDHAQQSLEELLGHLESLCEREEERIGDRSKGVLADRLALVEEACEVLGIACAGSPKAIREMADRLKNARR